MTSRYNEELSLVNDLMILSFDCVKKYSASIGGSLVINWNGYLNKKNGKNKKQRCLDKFKKNIDKLKGIEAKKDLSLEINNLRDNFNKRIILAYDEKIINGKYKKRILNIVDKFKLVSEILEVFLDEYIYLIEKKNELISKNTKDIVLPKRADSSKNVIKFYIDKNNYTYLNIKDNNGRLSINFNSIKNEYKLFNKCLDNNLDLNIWDGVDGKLAPYEKKRKVYIQRIFNILRDMKNVERKKIDVLYPVEKFYEYSKVILDELYKEMTDFKIKKDIYDQLTNLTISYYGADRLLGEYECLLKLFLNNVNAYNDYLLENALKCKDESRYREFKNIKGIVPVIEDIIGSLNKKIIKNVYINYNDYFLNDKDSFVLVTKYMNKDDVLLFYQNMNDAIRKDNYLNSIEINNRCNILYKNVFNILRFKFDLNNKQVKDILG